jgi:group I intron endonuclease
MDCGVYEIRNRTTGDFYIGSSSDLKERRRHHFDDLKRGDHHNRHLQSSYNKHGVGSFDFKILLLCSPEDMVIYEQALIDGLRPVYNKRLVAESNYGIKRSAEARKNISEAHKGIKYNLSDEYRKSLSERMKGNSFGSRVVYTKELREKKRLSMVGKNAGKKPSQSCRDAVSISNRTRVVSEETRRKMSVAQKARQEERRNHAI